MRTLDVRTKGGPLYLDVKGPYTNLWFGNWLLKRKSLKEAGGSYGLTTVLKTATVSPNLLK